MEDICIQCKQSALFSCSCDTLIRFCSDCYLLVHKNTQGNHHPINLEKTKNEKNQKILSNKEKKIKFFKFSKNLKEIQKQVQTNFNLFLQGHLHVINSVAVTSDNKYIISGSADKTIRI